MDNDTQPVVPLPAPEAVAGMRRQVLASGSGWRVVDVAYSSNPESRPFEDQHDLVTIAAVVAGSFQYRSTHGIEMLAPGALLLRGVSFMMCLLFSKTNRKPPLSLLNCARSRPVT